MLTYSFYESDPRVRQYTSALVRRGDIVDVIALRREGRPSREVLNGVNIYRIQKRNRNEKGRFAYAFKLLLFLIRSTIFITLKHLNRPYDLIHIHNVPDFLVFAAFVPKLTGTPTVLDIHDVLPEFYASKFNVNHGAVVYRLLLLLEKWSIAFSNHVIVANHIWESRLVSRSVSAEKCTTVCNYPEPYLFFPRSRNGSGDKFVITYPGSLNRHQGLDIAIKAFAKVVDQIPEAEFHIYGGGPAKAALVTLASQLGLEEKVKFHELLPLHEVAEVMAQSDVGVEPKLASSLFGNEASSTKILEFMAVHVPVVVSRTTVHTYYYDDSIVKFFESDSESDLADCLLLLRRDRPLRDRLVSNAAEFVVNNNWDVMKHEYLHLVDSLIAEQTGKTPTTRSAGGV